jgi:putative transposase
MEKIPRIHIENALYYVTSRGDNEENIFRDAGDYRMYLDLLKKYKQQLNFKLFSFVLLSNHVHLLIEPKEGTTISQIMHALNSNYTKYFNSRYGRKGHLLQERPKMVIVEKQGYLLGVSSYIHNNPYKLGLAAEAGVYEFSSYPLYAGIDPVFFIDIGEERREVEMLLSQASQSRTYAEYMNAVPAHEMDVLDKDLEKKNILGSEDFVRKVRSAAEDEKQPVLQVPQKTGGRFVFASKVLIAVLCVVAAALSVARINLKHRLNTLSHAKEMEYSAKLEKDREFIKKDLRELYRADLVSYQAMQKRLEIEKKKVTALEEKVKEQDKKNEKR